MKGTMMVKVATTSFDSAAYIRTAEEASLYLCDALESHDASVIAAALGTLARARGSTTVARATGISRASLYNGLRTGGNPTLETLLRVTGELGLELSARPKQTA
jgi:probable addiction module antidote protein